MGDGETAHNNIVVRLVRRHVVDWGYGLATRQRDWPRPIREPCEPTGPKGELVFAALPIWSCRSTIINLLVLAAKAYSFLVSRAVSGPGYA